MMLCADFYIVLFQLYKVNLECVKVGIVLVLVQKYTAKAKCLFKIEVEV